MISAITVDASASSPAIATDGWRISVLSAMKFTIRCTTQKSRVATTIASALAVKRLRNATESTIPMKIPAIEARRRIPRRASMR